MNPATPRAPSADTTVTFPILDTLRLVGALAVLTTHVAFQTGEYLRNGTWGVFLSRLDMGVAIFFVLSGFLLSRPHLAGAARALPRPQVARYAEKRVLRIWPVYVVTVVLALTLVPENDGAAADEWISSLLLLDSYHLAELPHGLTHMWSLSAEVAFYVLLPLLMLPVRSRRGISMLRTFAVLAGLVAVSLSWHLVVSDFLRPRTTAAPGIWFPAYLTWFAAGIGLAFVHVRWQDGQLPGWLRPVVRVCSQPGVCWVLAGGLALVASTSVAGPIILEEPTAAESLAKHLIYASIGTLLVGSGVFSPVDGLYAKAMSWYPLRHLGHVSYSIFCIHMLLLVTIVFPIAGVEEFDGHGLRVWAVTVALTVAVSEVLYRVVEMPALRLKTRLRRVEAEVGVSTNSPQDASTTR